MADPWCFGRIKPLCPRYTFVSELLTSRSIFKPWWYTSVSNVIKWSSSVTISDAWKIEIGQHMVHKKNDIFFRALKMWCYKLEARSMLPSDILPTCDAMGFILKLSISKWKRIHYNVSTHNLNSCPINVWARTVAHLWPAWMEMKMSLYLLIRCLQSTQW